MQATDDLRLFREIMRDLLLRELLPHVLHALGSQDHPDPALLSRQDAAKMLGVSIQTIASLVRDGAIDHVRVRRRVLIPQRSIVDYMERQSSALTEGATR